jgi:hypothetical protein
MSFPAHPVATSSPRARSLRRRSVRFALIACILASSVSQSAVKSIEVLDETTGMTMGALSQPLGFKETGIYDLLAPDKQPSIVYLGPVEWDRSGDYSYVLWVQVAPGVDGHRIDDIRAHGAIRLTLDDGSVELSAMDMPVAASSPYRLIAPVGQTAYFPISVTLLKRMAASRKLILNVRAGDLTMVDFIPLQETRAALTRFIIDRDISGD